MTTPSTSSDGLSATFERPPVQSLHPTVPEEPTEDPAELYDIVPMDLKTQYDVREVILRLIDRSQLREFNPFTARRSYAVSHASGVTR